MASALLNNRYRILRTLGRGGFGETFLAEDTHMPSSRACVIKQLKPAVSTPQNAQLIQDRFGREAAVLEKLGEGSNQIPKLYAYFSEAGQFYLVQEFIEGQTLTKKVEQLGSLDEKTVRDILVSLLPVLEYVHNQRMVHRDIKPDNIIVRQRDGLPVLIDFGAVKEAMNTVVNPQGSAINSMVIGTPGFMPSEQAAGRPTYSSDLYSLGLTAVYLLTGKLPQELPTDPRTGEIVWHQLTKGVSPHLSAVLDQAIQSHPRDRYTTAREMLDALHSGVSAVSPSPTPGVSHVATVAVSPAVAGSASPQVSVVLPPSGQKRQQNPLLIAGLVAAGVIGTAVVAKSIFNRPPAPSPSVLSSPQPTSKTPVQQSPFTTPEPSTSPPVPSPAVEQTPPAASAVPSPPQASPSPVTFDPPASSPPARNNPNQSSPTRVAAVDSVPAFPTGTTRSDVEAALGKPNIDVSGAWRTRAVVYQLVPDQIDLGYLFDRKSGRLRQTEASFAQSVAPQLMETTLNGLLSDGADNYIKDGLRRVYQRKTNSYTFTQGTLRGMIVRQNCDVIYISVWEAELHEIDVGSARKCS